MIRDHERVAPGGQSVRGGLIAEHRSLRRLPLSRRVMVVVVLLPVALNLVTWWARHAIGAVWAAIFSFWIKKLELSGSVGWTRTPGAGGFESALPWVEVVAKSPNAAIWWMVFGVTVAVVLLARFIPDRALPLQYSVWFACAIQATALLFFAVAPAAFPYTLPEYLRSSTRAALWFLLLVPWVHALVFYIFDFSLIQKIALTLMTLSFVIVVLPFQLMVHAYLIAKGSLLLMPLLYFVFGMPLLVFVGVAFYGWGMSWRHS